MYHLRIFDGAKGLVSNHFLVRTHALMLMVSALASYGVLWPRLRQSPRFLPAR